MTSPEHGHPEHEDFPWTISVADHPPRTESSQYRASRKLMGDLVGTTGDWVFAPGPYQDHHGGGVWVKDSDGWLCLFLPLGIEWSAQFCADPSKVDHVRRYAARVVGAFPDTLPGYASFGYDDGQRLLDTPIETADQVAEWTDSIFNASVPLPAGTHSGVLPKTAGYHHYPKPIVDIDHFRYDDFALFVTDDSGLPAAVVPISPRGSGDGRVRLLAAHPSSPYAKRLTSPGPAEPSARTEEALASGEERNVLPADDLLAQQAFRKQS
ncbi:DUF6424 family protein [Streptomyces sp. NBC_01525]|uniref:Uncharacterized protein n=1 Tax=Streptomyces benahoarensis TaxID=2595054 RepID=A0A553ZRK3_9ACTN|nr:DUF6424 family protein [Streptomyces benahoarensis]TSB32716.1 hypothetical protein FNJ62_00030 [Streptomyces benahoarensis]TSB44111.1 hypothetical protein FNZ23_00365 [Streptomyces benahoarensis]